MKARTSPYLTFTVVIATVLAVGSVALLWSRSETKSPDPAVPASPLVDLELQKQPPGKQGSGYSSTKLPLFGDQIPVNDPQVMRSLAHVLVKDKDPLVRAAIASSIGASRSKLHEKKVFLVEHEPFVIDILHTAFILERDSNVRRQIVSAAVEFNHADAASVLEDALKDADHSVRETAQKGLVRRQQRLDWLRSA